MKKTNNSFTARQISESMNVAIRTTKDHKFLLSLGMEEEFFVFDIGTEKPIDLLSFKYFFDELYQRQSKHLWLGKGRDLGKNMMELAFRPAQSLWEYMHMVQCVFCWMSKNEVSKNWYFVFGDNPDSSLGYDPQPRYQALVRAVSNSKEFVAQMTKYASFQINIGVEGIGGLCTEKARRLIYILNNWAPALALNVEYASGAETSSRLPRAYTNIVNDSRRCPHCISLQDAMNFESYLTSIPHLIVDSGSGWEPGIGEYPSCVEDVNMADIWWSTRPKWDNEEGDDCLTAERIEKRMLTIMPPHRSISIVSWFDNIVRNILDDSQKLPVLSDNDWHFIRSKKNGARKCAKNFLGSNWLPCEVRVNHPF
jgi:hypothetical protein